MRPDRWAIDADDSVEVPVTEPTTATDGHLTWQIRHDLAIQHADRFEGYPSPRGRHDGGPTRHADPALTLPDYTRLVVTLTSLQSWRSELNTAFASAALAKHRELRRAHPLPHH